MTGRQTWAIILAAGSGTRMGALPTAKQFLLWRQRPLYWHSALAMSRAGCVHGLVFVFPQGAGEGERVERLAWRDNLALPWQIAVGGPRRQDSCRNGIALLPRDCQQVLIHDAARPFVSPALIRRVCEAIDADHPCIVPGIPVADTIKMLEDASGGLTQCTLPRQRLVAAQTPQGFETRILRDAQGWDADVTDDAMLLENMGFRVKIVPGEEDNSKITTPRDLENLTRGAHGGLAMRINCHGENTSRSAAGSPCAASMTARELVPVSGFGYDVHRYGPGRSLRLGGVPINSQLQVVAHSDGDALLHALMDALLGVASLGDIGDHFPDDDPALEGISSAVLLDKVLGWLKERQIVLIHVDLTVVAQKPRLASHRKAIRENVARLLSLDSEEVSCKATTEEGLGFTGAEAGIKAYALVSALKPVPLPDPWQPLP